MDFRTAEVSKTPAAEAPPKEGARWTPANYVLAVLIAVAAALGMVGALWR